MWILCLAEDSLETSSLFSLKNNETIFMNVVCCSRDWRFWGLSAAIQSAEALDIIKSL